MTRGREERAPSPLVERLADVEAVVDLADVETIARASFTEDGFSAVEELTRPWSRLWIVRTAPATAVMGFLVAWHVADELHVLNIATTPSMRRRGLARALMAEALRYAAASHVRLLLLEVRRSNVAAIKLYRGLDFVATGVRASYYADNGEDAIEMMLTLDPATGHALPGRDEIRIDG